MLQEIIAGLLSFFVPIILRYIRVQIEKNKVSQDEKKFSEGDEEAQNRLDNP